MIRLLAILALLLSLAFPAAADQLDYLCIFASSTAAQADAVVGQYYVPASADGPGGWRQDVVFPGLKVVTPTAVVDGISALTGFWLMISLPQDSAALDAKANCVVKIDRDAANGSYTPGAAAIPQAIASITYSAPTATVTTAAPHGLSSYSRVLLTGQTSVGYSGSYEVTVTGASTFTYQPADVTDNPITGPASVVGTYTATLPATASKTFVSGSLTGARRSSMVISPVPAGALYPRPLGQ